VVEVSYITRDPFQYIVLVDVGSNWPDVIGPFDYEYARKVDQDLTARSHRCTVQALFSTPSEFEEELDALRGDDE
jgi:hypothetical protein